MARAQHPFSVLQQQMSNLVTKENEDRIIEQFTSNLPYDTGTLFLVLVVLVIILLVIAISCLAVRYCQARAEGRLSRAARTLNIDTGGIGAPKHVLSPVPNIPMMNLGTQTPN